MQNINELMSRERKSIQMHFVKLRINELGPENMFFTLQRSFDSMEIIGGY